MCVVCEDGAQVARVRVLDVQMCISLCISVPVLLRIPAAVDMRPEPTRGPRLLPTFLTAVT